MPIASLLFLGTCTSKLANYKDLDKDHRKQ